MDHPFGALPAPEPGHTPSTNGHAPRGGAGPGRHACPSCGAAGVRFLRSTGRWYPDRTGAGRFGYVTFCAACGHEYGEAAAT